LTILLRGVFGSGKTAGRKVQFLDPALLNSQLETPEEPTNARVVHVDADRDSVIDSVEEGWVEPMPSGRTSELRRTAGGRRG